MVSNFIKKTVLFEPCIISQSLYILVTFYYDRAQMILRICLLCVFLMSICNALNKDTVLDNNFIDNKSVGLIVLGKGQRSQDDQLIKDICDGTIQAYINIPKNNNVTIIVSDDKGTNVIKEYLEFDGRIPKGVKIIPEKKGYNTLANAYFSEKLCRKNGIRKVVIIVTKKHKAIYKNSFDIYFAWKFRNYDLNYTEVDTPNDPLEPNFFNKLSDGFPLIKGGPRLIDCLIKTRILYIFNLIKRFLYEQILPRFKPS